MNINSISPINFQTLKTNLKETTSAPVFKAASVPISAQACNTLKSIVLFKGSPSKNYEEIALSGGRKERLEEFSKKYDLAFNDINNLSTAFSYGYYANGDEVPEDKNYQRLEHIGDAVLEICVTDMLQKKYPQAREAELTDRRTAIVCNKNIANWGRSLEFEKVITNPEGMVLEKRYADMFEALLGAIFVDAGGIQGGGVDKVYKFIQDNFKENILNSKPVEQKTNRTKTVENKHKQETNVSYQSQLSKQIERKYGPRMSSAIKYKIKSADKQTDANFRAYITCKNKDIAKGAGLSEEEAKENAARNGLDRLKAGEISLY